MAYKYALVWISGKFKCSNVTFCLYFFTHFDKKCKKETSSAKREYVVLALLIQRWSNKKNKDNELLVKHIWKIWIKFPELWKWLSYFFYLCTITKKEFFFNEKLVS